MKERTIYALGFFDGVHLGHQALLRECKRMAQAQNCRAGVITFSVHPLSLVSQDAPKLINTPAERKQLLLQHGMDCVLTLSFDEKMMRLPWRDFFRLITTEYGACGLVCGEDFRFGWRGEGTAQLLQALCQEEGIECFVVAQQLLDGITVSSTHIRTLLEEGKLSDAVRFLGHPHILSGTVISGQHLGRTMGIPTANLALADSIVCPKHGVYACKATIDGAEHLAVTNIGTRPTVGGSEVAVEAYLLDFCADIYGKTLTLSFYDYLRQEQKFPNLDELQAQIQENAASVRKIFEKT